MHAVRSSCLIKGDTISCTSTPPPLVPALDESRDNGTTLGASLLLTPSPLPLPHYHKYLVSTNNLTLFITAIGSQANKVGNSSLLHICFLRYPP
ncbi:hypothetical protein CEXT_732571 [Caerostris extrusa]|uniref:Uncharacterized protein n=1 Tax=Caerostris extrusa TaxID=172846 RepID=A0AAV4R244_CAEEX|nr:hypothetical protein CEXT_732571 [Caerostris extrusa]